MNPNHIGTNFDDFLKEEGIMADKYIICPRCKGKGEVYDINWLGAVATFGISLLGDLSYPETCPICNGTGLVNIGGNSER